MWPYGVAESDGVLQLVCGIKSMMHTTAKNQALMLHTTTVQVWLRISYLAAKANGGIHARTGTVF